MEKKTLAIISSYHENCGIAEYTERIEPVLREYYAVQVLKLETEVLKSDNKELCALGDRLIDEMAEQLKAFDCVNIQFEAGLFGFDSEIVLRRVKKLLSNVNNLVFTFHTVVFAMPQLSKGRLLSRHMFRVLREYFSGRRWPMMYKRLIKTIKQIDDTPGKQASIIVHDEKSKRFINRVYKFEHVYAHPLGLSARSERELPHTEAEKADFRGKYDLPEGIVTVGIFGFVSEYKGHLLAIKALQHLPPEYHLLVFGEQHPASIQAYVPVDPYLDKLLTYIDDADRSATKGAKRDKKLDSKQKVTKLASRVHFFGSVNNDDFAQAMRCCDIVLLPYVEVNQMGSGIAALALENHANAIYANTKCFHELANYFPNCFPFFDIGNYLQLAQHIRNYKNVYDEAISKALSVYNLEENVRRYYVNMFER